MSVQLKLWRCSLPSEAPQFLSIECRSVNLYTVKMSSMLAVDHNVWCQDLPNQLTRGGGRRDENACLKCGL